MALQLKDEQVAQAILASRQSYTVEVPDVGVFQCHTQTFRDEADVMAFQSNFLISRGVNPATASTQMLFYGYLMGMVYTLCDKAPSGFIPDAQPREVIEDLVNRMLEYEETFRTGRAGADADVEKPPEIVSALDSVPHI